MKGKIKLFPILSTLWVITALALGFWWLYLLFMIETRVGNLTGILDQLGLKPGFINMLKWEGSTFILLIIFLSISLFILYYKDQKKTKALQAFFAGLTHELKTPLASIRLQSEVIKDSIEENYKEDQLLDKLSTRLIDDTANLETQMDKILQLSRLERGGTLNPTPVKLLSVVKSIVRKRGEGLHFKDLDTLENYTVLADHFALELILKNLIENTKAHSLEQNVKIEVKQENLHTVLTYEDGGKFEGDLKKLGELFYKYNSAKGSGIGLYLIKKLMSKMDGQFEISSKGEGLKFTLLFKSHQESNND